MPAYDIVTRLEDAPEYCNLPPRLIEQILQEFARKHGPSVPYPEQVTQRAIALDMDADIIGILLTYGNLEGMFLWVHEAHRRQGVGTALVKHHGEGGGIGCSEEGRAFLLALHGKLTEAERKSFDIPCWASLSTKGPTDASL